MKTLVGTYEFWHPDRRSLNARLRMAMEAARRLR